MDEMDEMDEMDKIDKIDNATNLDEILVDRADTFMNRRRGMFPASKPIAPQTTKTALGPPASHTAPAAARLAHELASSEKPLIHTQQPELPSLEAAIPTLNDLAEPTPDSRDALVSGVDPAVLKILVSEVSRNISRHLTSELAEILYNSTLATLEADLRRGIIAATEVAARNFIAQRLRLSSTKQV